MIPNFLFSYQNSKYINGSGFSLKFKVRNSKTQSPIALKKLLFKTISPFSSTL
ncbi:MAG: hypothetical protein ACTTJC_08960 [Campylobacter sp.]